uniref:SOCS box domain-containing protein n=1 Tax=Heterorhabditis bacteriophora TaxID=37862 RepID=A0A1I7WSY0_HETBA
MTGPTRKNTASEISARIRRLRPNRNNPLAMPSENSASAPEISNRLRRLHPNRNSSIPISRTYLYFYTWGVSFSLFYVVLRGIFYYEYHSSRISFDSHLNSLRLFLCGLFYTNFPSLLNIIYLSLSPVGEACPSGSASTSELSIPTYSDIDRSRIYKLPQRGPQRTISPAHPHAVLSFSKMLVYDYEISAIKATTQLVSLAFYPNDDFVQPCTLDDLLRPAKLDIVLNSSIDRETQALHAWNPDDRSLNIFVKDDDCFTFHRHPVAQSTDCIRGKVCFNFVPSTALKHEGSATMIQNTVVHGYILRAFRFAETILLFLISLYPSLHFLHGILLIHGLISRLLPWTHVTFSLVLLLILNLPFLIISIYGQQFLMINYFYRKFPAPRPLMDICRRTIRVQMGRQRLNRVDELRLPPSLKRYIQYK